MRENYTLARLYVVEALSPSEVMALPKEQAHYIANVLRRKVSDELRVFNGRDGEWRASIVEMSRKEVSIQIAERLREPQHCPDIWLCFAPVRKHRNAVILEKCTELGIAEFHPVITHPHTISQNPVG